MKKKRKVEIEGDVRAFMPGYFVTVEATTSKQFTKTKFADMPSSGIWTDRTETDDELLEGLGNGWRGFER